MNLMIDHQMIQNFDINITPTNLKSKTIWDYFGDYMLDHTSYPLGSPLHCYFDAWFKLPWELLLF